MTNKSEIDELREIVKHQSAELAAVKQQLSPTVSSEKEAAEWQNKMHQIREARASQFNPFTPDQLRAMHEACPDPQAIVHDQRNAPMGPASVIPRSQPASNVRQPVNTTGWQHQIPLRNGLGQGK